MRRNVKVDATHWTSALDEADRRIFLVRMRCARETRNYAVLEEVKPAVVSPV